jgi:hypothetical protein
VAAGLLVLDAGRSVEELAGALAGLWQQGVGPSSVLVVHAPPADPSAALTLVGFGANGIRALPGADLVFVSSGGGLFRVDPATGRTTKLLRQRSCRAATGSSSSVAPCTW